MIRHVQQGLEKTRRDQILSTTDTEPVDSWTKKWASRQQTVQSFPIQIKGFTMYFDNISGFRTLPYLHYYHNWIFNDLAEFLHWWYHYNLGKNWENPKDINQKGDNNNTKHKCTI